MVSLRRSNRLDEVGPSSIYDLIRPFSIRPYLYRVRKYVLIASRIRREKKTKLHAALGINVQE